MVLVHVLFLFFVFFVLCQNGIEAIHWNLTQEEHLELEKQLKILNKPAIKTIYSENGDIYDCVNFYEQPAFDHPLLKDKKFEFEIPAASSNDNNEEQISSNSILDFGLKDEECPIGTVIIRRLTKEDLIREKIALNMRNRALIENSNRHYAVVRTVLDSPKRYTGAGATLTIYNPQVNGKQYSATRLLLHNGPDTIEVGWRVDPSLNGDKRTRFYIRTDSRDTHCYYTSCPGFVLTTRTFALNSIFNTITTGNGTSYGIHVDVNRDPSKNWVLRIGPYGKLQVGFWPEKIFSVIGLADLASYIEWGGEVFNPLDCPKPPMGIGSIPKSSTKDSSFIEKVTYRNETGLKMDATGLEVFTDDENYRAIDVPITDNIFKHLVLYGGPGNSVDNLKV